MFLMKSCFALKLFPDSFIIRLPKTRYSLG